MPVNRPHSTPVDDVAVAQEQLLREKLAERGLLKNASRIERRPPGSTVPLSSTQRRMWFAQNLFPDDASPNMVVGLRIDGPLDVDALRAALTGLFERHTILRTRYRLGDGGKPIQEIGPPERPEIPVVDIGVDQRPDDAVAAAAQEIADRPFDLATEPSLRIRLLRSADQVHYLLMVLHHIAADETTWANVFADLRSGYAYATGRSAAHDPPPALDYADYAVWEQQRVRGGGLDAQLNYWADRLDSVPTAVGFPNVSPPGPSGSDSVGQQCISPMTETAVAAVTDLAREQRAPAFAVVLAGLATVLHRYTDATDLVIGIPVLVRDRPEVNELSGNFTNTLALRIAVDDQSTFGEVLDRTKTAFFRGHDNRDIPFEMVVERVAPQRTHGRPPLFEVMFTATRSVTDALELAGTTTTDLRLRTQTSMFDLAIDLVDDAVLAADFRTAKYSPDFVQQILGHIASVLEQGARDPGQRVANLDLGSAAPGNRPGDTTGTADLRVLDENGRTPAPGVVGNVHTGEGSEGGRRGRLRADGTVEYLDHRHRGDRISDARPDGLAGLADGIAETLLTLDQGSLCLFGHSMGALVAYEVAHRLEAAGHGDALRLCVSSYTAPHLFGQDAASDVDEETFIEHARASTAETASGNGEPSAFDNPALREMILDGLRADFAMLGRYGADRQTRLNAPILVLQGSDEPIDPAEMAAWQDSTRGSCEFRAEGFHSVWPVGKTPPAGWRTADVEGDRAACLAAIAETWKDMRPESLRRRELVRAGADG